MPTKLHICQVLQNIFGYTLTKFVTFKKFLKKIEHMFDFCFLLCYTMVTKGIRNETVFGIWNIYVRVEKEKDNSKRDCRKF